MYNSDYGISYSSIFLQWYRRNLDGKSGPVYPLRPKAPCRYTVKEEFRGYTLKACPVKTVKGRWSAAVEISSGSGGSPVLFTSHDGISYILEEEAAKESLNLGKNLVKNGMI